MEGTYKLGTRKSPLALKQVEEILGPLRANYPFLRIEVIGLDTTGDKDRRTAFSEVEGSDFFTKEIDKALLEKKIDIAVHSAKDLPDSLLDGLVLAARTTSIDPVDVLVARNGSKLSELAPGAKVGTSSNRRKVQLRAYRKDLKIIDIRGNIEERLKFVGRPRTSPGKQQLDAIVIAAAGLLRLGLENRITQRLPIEMFSPHPQQGKLAVLVRKEDRTLFELLSVLDTDGARKIKKEGDVG